MWNSFWNTQRASGSYRNSISFITDLIFLDDKCHWNEVQLLRLFSLTSVRFLFKHGACHVTPDPSKRPRRRWSRRMGSLEVMVKSMLDLRQLETFAHKKNGSSNEKERQSTHKRHQPWLSLHSSKVIRDPDGATCYPEENQEDASLRGRYCTSLFRAHSNSHSNTDREQKCWGCLFLSIVLHGFPPVTHCCQTSAVRRGWGRGRTAGCNGGTRAVTARRATARTALAMWAMTAWGPAPIVTSMVSSILFIQKSLNTMYLFCKIITVLTWKIFKNRLKLCD